MQIQILNFISNFEIERHFQEISYSDFISTTSILWKGMYGSSDTARATVKNARPALMDPIE